MMHALLLLSYLIGSVTFIVGLKMLAQPATARKGNLVAAAGMLVAILGTLFLYREGGKGLHNFGWIFGGIFIGGTIGVVSARKVKMTAMPEMVSMFNGMGGLCAALIGIIEFDHLSKLPLVSGILADGTNVTIIARDFQDNLATGLLLILLIEVVIGTISFTGSMVAWGKLNGKFKDKIFPGQKVLNFVVLAGLLVLVVLLLVICPQQAALNNGYMAILPVSGTALLVFGLIILLAVLYGIFFVLPIGGADMPVVISLLNACTGVAAGCGGLLYDNAVMITGGILVGSAGGILTILMCRAMNRSLKNVLLGAFGTAKGTSDTAGESVGSIREISVNDAAIVLGYARNVIIVPGYGLAVAQAQHTCHELEKALEEKGVTVQYGIHPVAGRMPGHMNVLLAEADVSYDKLLEMEAANEAFPNTSVVLILGANDVVNPAALEDAGSPIYGMPVLEVEHAEHVIVNKRSMKPGYAGIENSLFFRPKTSMLFGDAKKALQELIAALKEI